MAENNELHIPQKAPALIARDLLATRFPDLENRIRKAFRLSSTFRDLCEDYYLVIFRQSEIPNDQMDGEDSANHILQTLKIELEQEMFNYFKSFNS
jgi:hypothetical protein